MLDFSAIVLAAGRSTRMGRDKALLEVDGVTLWQRQRDVLATAGATEIFLSARPDQTWTRHVSGFSAVLHDALPECGPLVGITAGIERASQPMLAVLAIDLPAMDVAWFRTLVDQASSGIGVVGRRGDFFEPLAAIYPREFMWSAWEALAKGEYALQPLIARAVNDGLLHERVIETGDEARFVNWNRP
jgi:molybdopterin-guanine dinucleotide biosynthesis protein A